ncbi:hypothetical protein J1614_003880 [Plenodomus biglobosus]|nr:hypothetical protein J1614_003880 [Plenodomus biglobosus]
MLRQSRAGVPMEVMGLISGEFVDDYRARVVNVFDMPQSGTGVSVEAVRPLPPDKDDGHAATNRQARDRRRLQFFEQLTPRAVAVVVDPIQSVTGKVVIDAFRLINQQTLMMGHEPRQTTSNVGHLSKPSIQALIHGLNRISFRKPTLEENMPMNLHKHVCTETLLMDDFKGEADRNMDRLQNLISLSEGYEKRLMEETELTKDQLTMRYVGKVDPRSVRLPTKYHLWHLHAC